jgi:uncharacterized protein YacL
MVKEKKEKGVPLPFRIPQQVMHQLADLIATAVIKRIPKDVFRRKPRRAKGKKLDNPMVLDTSAIIDGRIYDVAKLGFIVGDLLVPDFILSELKHVADASDSLKRARGRRGLELLEKMRKIKGLRFKVLDDLEFVEAKDNDEKLLKIAKKIKGRLITSDFNLNKKASVEGVKVLNINELANSIKTIALPGEEMRITLVAQGKGKDQGVGYLPDGTMIVVEEGAGRVGEEVYAIVARVFQTAAGRMIFARLKNG